MIWLTNTSADTAFELLCQLTAQFPNRHFTIGPPHSPEPFTAYMYYDKPVTIKGATKEYLESINYRGIYEVFLPEDSNKSDI